MSLLSFLYQQRVRGFRPPATPHLDDAALARFTALLEASTCYLEFGAGGSTLLADRLGKQGVSVESDRFYAAVVRGALRADTRMTVLAVDIGMTKQWGRPVFQRPTRARLRRWQRYSTAPFAHFDAAGCFPELALVDGRFRRACALETARQAGLRGRSMHIMIDDYYTSGRAHYARVEAHLGVPEPCGRAALFHISAQQPVTPAPAELAEANADFR